MTIKLLNEQTIGKIAAGEVIERPVSIVKELFENAIDSGAHRISVEVLNGGLREIRVVDDGCGIASGEIELAVQRHATSKLGSFDDLARILSLGFRGEALASIGAVSRLQIRSTAYGDNHGTRLNADFGSEPIIAAIAGNRGTVVTVSDLFENVPARLKFLRQPGTESSVITRVVSAYAASRPDLAIQLTNDGRSVFVTDGTGELIATAASVFGQDVGHAALELPELDESAHVPGISATGWVTGPAVTRAHRQQLHFFVNGRLIQHRSLSFIVEECYHTLLMVGRHPLGVIRIEIEPELVDVNVHPTKAEVRFVDERSVARAVRRTVHGALAGAPSDNLPRVTFSITGIELPQQLTQPTLINAVSRSSPVPEPEPDLSPAKPDRPGAIPMLRVLGQVGGTYIIAEGPEGLYLIDQHAAHERVMYERLRARINGTMLDIQPMLDPIIIDLDPHETAVMEQSIAELNQIGFQIEPFGPQAFAIRAVPAMMIGVDIRARMHLILEELASGGVGDSWFDSVAISAACHTSIRAGQVMTIAEMRELVIQLEQTEHPRACGHGRPTMLLMSQIDLEKQFSRR